MFCITSAAIFGINAIPVSIETDIARGLPSFTIVGLPDTSVRESRDRIRSALRNSGFSFPRGRVTVNLAPAHLRKQGALFDLSIALSILLRAGIVHANVLKQAVILGELGLHGEIRPVQSVLPVAVMTSKQTVPLLILPKHNAPEAALISAIQVIGVETLKEVVEHVTEQRVISPTPCDLSLQTSTFGYCFSQILGHQFAKRGLEIAAAGGHNVILQGPPGTGKTLLSRTFPSILPPLTEAQAVEVATIKSVAGMRRDYNTLSLTRPFRNPHHSCSAISLIGGGTWPMPGEVSLAHHGVLFLDELPEFGRHALETLRQPLEDGVVTIARAAGSMTFPSKFQLLATRNPCPCGYLHDPKRQCECDIRAISAYERRVSGPLMDRIDLVIDVPNIDRKDLVDNSTNEPSHEIQQRVLQTWNFRKTHNQLKPPLSTSAKSLLDAVFARASLSTRGYFRVQQIAYTIASMATSETIEEEHVAEAIKFRHHERTSL